MSSSVLSVRLSDEERVLWLDEVECHILQQSDSLWFESNRGHRWFNPTKKPTVILWVNTPPTF